METVLPEIRGSERERLEQFTTPEERDVMAGLLRRQLLALAFGCEYDSWQTFMS